MCDLGIALFMADMEDDSPDACELIEEWAIFPEPEEDERYNLTDAGRAALARARAAERREAMAGARMSRRWLGLGRARP